MLENGRECHIDRRGYNGYIGVVVSRFLSVLRVLLGVAIGIGLWLLAVAVLWGVVFWLYIFIQVYRYGPLWLELLMVVGLVGTGFGIWKLVDWVHEKNL